MVVSSDLAISLREQGAPLYRFACTASDYVQSWPGSMAAGFATLDTRALSMGAIGNKSSTRSEPGNFKAAYCDHFRCPPERYEDEVFWRCLFRHALPLAFLIRRLNPGYFTEDMDLIREVGATTTQPLFKNEINYFYGRNLRDKSWLRKTFRIRVSGNRLIRLRRRFLPV